MLNNYEIEVWKNIPGYQNYLISSFGRVKSIITSKILKFDENVGGYYRVRLYRNKKQKSFLVHVLVALVFIGERPLGNEVRHLDGDSHNNNLSNIQYGSRKQNQDDQIKHGTYTIGTMASNTKLSPQEVGHIRKLKKYNNISPSTIAEILGVNISTVSTILNERTWRPRPYVDIIKKQIEYHKDINTEKTWKVICSTLEELRLIDVEGEHYQEAKMIVNSVEIDLETL